MENVATKISESNLDTGMGKQDRSKVAKGLSMALAETYVIYLKTQALHWNVVGPFFYGVHKLTEAQYENLSAAIDEIAERIRALGFPAPVSFQKFSGLATTKEWVELPKAEDAIRILVDDHEHISKAFRKIVKDADEMDDVVTADMITARIQHHDNMAWMLRSVMGE